MSKRKYSQIQNPANYNKPAIFPQALQDKVNVVSGQSQEPQIYNDINQASQNLNPVQRNLADFIFKQLGDNQNFPQLNLQDKPPTRNDPQAFYNMTPGDREMTMYRPHNESVNPIVTLMHEGTHFLDDERMRTYQQPTMNFLAKHQPNMQVAKDNGNWYTHAQNILPRTTGFSKSYPFKGLKTGDDSLIKHYNQQYIDNGQAEAPNQNPTYQNLNNSLQLSRKEGRIYSQMSEFPAFITESLDRPWEVRWSPANATDNIQNISKPGHSNLGRKYLNKMTKATYRGFKDIDNNFPQNYPHANQAFIDRMSDLRNINKYPTAQDYQRHLLDKSTVQQPISSSSQSSSSSSNPIHAAIGGGQSSLPSSSSQFSSIPSPHTPPSSPSTPVFYSPVSLPNPPPTYKQGGTVHSLAERVYPFKLRQYKSFL